MKNNLKAIGLYLLIIIFPFVAAGLYISKRTNNKWKGILIAVIAGIISFNLLNDGSEVTNQSTQIFELSQELEKSQAKIEKLESKNQESPRATIINSVKPSPSPSKEAKKKEYIFSSGNYISGPDFEPGIYNIIAIEGNGNVYSSNAFEGGLNAMMGTDKDYYEQEYKNIKLPKNTELTISSVKIKLVRRD